MSLRKMKTRRLLSQPTSSEAKACNEGLQTKMQKVRAAGGSAANSLLHAVVFIIIILIGSSTYRYQHQ